MLKAFHCVQCVFAFYLCFGSIIWESATTVSCSNQRCRSTALAPEILGIVRRIIC